MRILPVFIALAFVATRLGAASLPPHAPVLLQSGQSAFVPNPGERVVMWATWAEAPDWTVTGAAPAAVFPGQFEIDLDGERYTLTAGPFEGSQSGATTFDYSTGVDQPAGEGRPLWSDSRGNYGIAASVTNDSTPDLAYDYALTAGTSRTLGWNQMPATYLRFHWPDDTATMYGVVERLSADRKTVIASGTYHARSFGQIVDLTEYAKVTWYKDGVRVIRHDLSSGDTPDWLDIPSYTEADRGTYTMHVENSKGAVDVSFQVGPPRNRIVTAPAAGGRLVNISTRTFVGTGNDLLIGGCVISGGQAQILVRASGPALIDQGVSGVLAHPRLRVFDHGRVIGENIAWGTSPDVARMPALFAKLGAFPLQTGSADSATLLTLAQGPYTFQVTGADGGTGVALIEIYIVSDSGLPGYLVNLSSRGVSGNGDRVMITGFVTSGDTQVLVRGIGPGLISQGVETGTIARPILNVFDHGTRIDSLSAWGAEYETTVLAALFRKLGAFALPVDSADSAVVLNLQTGRGIRTVMVNNRDSGSGVAMAEVYLVQP